MYLGIKDCFLTSLSHGLYNSSPLLDMMCDQINHGMNIICLWSNVDIFWFSELRDNYGSGSDFRN